MIPLAAFCLVYCTQDIPVVIGRRPINERIVEAWQTQNPGDPGPNPSCYVEGHFYSSCPTTYKR